jgi:hypothetical protein
MTTNKEIATNNLKTALTNYTGDRLKFLKILEGLIGVADIEEHFCFEPHESSKKVFYYEHEKDDFEYSFFKGIVYDLLPEDHLRKINIERRDYDEALSYLCNLEENHKEYYFLLFKIYVGLLIKNLEVFLKDIDLFISESFQGLIKFSSDDPSNLLKLDKNNLFLEDWDDQDYLEGIISEIEFSIYDEEIELILKSIPFLN